MPAGFSVVSRQVRVRHSPDRAIQAPRAKPRHRSRPSALRIELTKSRDGLHNSVGEAKGRGTSESWDQGLGAAGLANPAPASSPPGSRQG